MDKKTPHKNLDPSYISEDGIYRTPMAERIEAAFEYEYIKKDGVLVPITYGEVLKRHHISSNN